MCSWSGRTAATERPERHRRETLQSRIVEATTRLPKDATHWPCRSMAREVGLSRNLVNRASAGAKPRSGIRRRATLPRQHGHWPLARGRRGGQGWWPGAVENDHV